MLEQLDHLMFELSKTTVNNIARHSERILGIESHISRGQIKQNKNEE